MIQNSTTTPPNEDSICKPIIQLMSSVNQQQMRVRKPSESSENRRTQSIPDNQQPRNPQSSTQVTLQLASDRVSPNGNVNDLLLIQEEPSLKEESQQLSMFKKANDSHFIYLKSRLTKQKISRSSFSMIQRESNSILLHPNLTKRQFKIINDMGAQQVVQFKDIINRLIQQDCVLKIILHGLYALVLLFYLTTMLIEIGCDQLSITNQISLQCFMLVAQLLDTSYQLIIIHSNYSAIVFDSMTLLPFIAYIMGDHEAQKVLYFLYLIRIRKINSFLTKMHCYSNWLSCLFVCKCVVQLHFATFLTQTIIYLFAQTQEEYHIFVENIFQLIFTAPLISPKYVFIVYLFRVVLVGFYIYNLKIILNYQPVQIDNSTNFKPKTQQLILEQIENNKNQSFDINLMPEYLQKQMKRQKYIKVLKDINIFTQSFSHQTLLSICDLIQEVTLAPNEVVEQDSSLYFHLDGIVDLALKFSEYRDFKLTTIETQFEIFNNLGFFKNQMQGLRFKSIGVSKIAFIEQQRFYQLIRQCPREFQKYRMLIDTIIIENNDQLANISCFICQQSHDITQCPTIHYKPNRNWIIQCIKATASQKRIPDFKRAHKKRKRVQYQPGDDSSESFESEKQDLVVPFDRILPSQNSSISLTNNNQNQQNFNPLEISSVPYVNYSHSGQTLFSKKVDSENYFSIPGISSSQGNSSRKIILNEFKEPVQSKFQRFGQLEEQSGSSFQCNPMQKVQDSLAYNKKRTSKSSKTNKQDQLQRYQTDIPCEHSNRNDRKNNTIAHSLMQKKRQSIQAQISIEDNFIQSFERISRFDDYFPHYNVDQQINNYQRIQSINNNP